MAGVGRRLDYWGFDAQGLVTEAPVAVSGGFTHRGQIHDDPRALELWSALKKAVEKRGRDVVIEEGGVYVVQPRHGDAHPVTRWLRRAPTGLGRQCQQPGAPDAAPRPPGAMRRS